MNNNIKTLESLFSQLERLEGWGRSKSSISRVFYPDLEESIQQLLQDQNKDIFLARGKGRSYGDASLNHKHNSISFKDLNRAVHFNRKTGVFTCEAGMTLKEIIDCALPSGWFLPVTPGTQHPTLGGCFACNVHGKNHHRAGSISNHVHWIELITASGEVKRCSHERNADLFHATAGGLGLTGIITHLSLQLVKIPSAYIAAETILCPNLSSLMNTLAAKDALYPYSVAWLDGTAMGDALGRGEVILGRHAEIDQLPEILQAYPYRVRYKPVHTVPFILPISLVNPWTILMFNKLHYEKSKFIKESSIQQYNTYFYPLDVVDKWNRIYGPRGFIQYQFVVPFEGGRQALTKALKICQRFNLPPSLAVLKRFGEGNPLLSFPRPGWTLALDIPNVNGLSKLVRELDSIILDHRGRIYLGKDSSLTPSSFRKMYPEFGEWMKIKQKVDPHWRFQSDLSRRLQFKEG